MTQQRHHGRVAAVRSAVNADPRSVDVRPAPERLHSFSHVIDLDLPKFHVDLIERLFAPAWRGARVQIHHEETILGRRARRDEGLARGVAR
jgi:hypothetical protein